MLTPLAQSPFSPPPEQWRGLEEPWREGQSTWRKPHTSAMNFAWGKNRCLFFVKVWVFCCFLFVFWLRGSCSCVQVSAEDDRICLISPRGWNYRQLWGAYDGCCEQNLRSSVKAANMLNFQAKNACSLKPQERWDCLARDWSSKGPK